VEKNSEEKRVQHHFGHELPRYHKKQMKKTTVMEKRVHNIFISSLTKAAIIETTKTNLLYCSFSRNLLGSDFVSRSTILSHVRIC